MAQIFSGGRMGRLKSCGGLIALLLLGCAKGETAPQENYLEAEDLNPFVKVLQENPNGVLANRNGEKLRTQIITFQFAEGKRAYFATNSTKLLYEQLKRHPNISYCTFAEEFEPVLSINGKVVFTEDAAIKLRVFNGSANVQRFYQTTDNPVYKVFYIDTEEIETFDSYGAKRYKLK
ncbi:hypothetical protein AGMMS49942_25590 [Spirochaetia bacterium]|nr:hypothetical protein AGMMS49942_25590 [Spirochaetia bacterium]